MRLRSVLAVALAALFAVTAIRDARGGEAELLTVLRSSAGLHQKARACQQLAVVGGKNAVPVLAALLHDEQLADYARFALEPIDEPGVDEALREAAGKLDGRRLAGVVNSIGTRRDAEATAILRGLVRAPAKGAAPEALMALGMIATEDAVETLRDIVENGPKPLRATAADAALTAAERLLAAKKREQAVALCDAVRRASVPLHLQAAATYQGILAQGASGLPLLMEQLASGDRAMARVALRAARELPGNGVSRGLAAELRGRPPALQMQLIRILADRGDPDALEGVEAATASGGDAVRQAALQALGKIGKVSSVPALLKSAAADGAEAKTAVASLRTIKGNGIDAAILAAVQGGTPRFRAALIDVLADRHCTAAVATLLQFAAGSDEAVAKAAWKGLGALACPEDLPAMLGLLSRGGGSSTRDAESAIVKAAAGRHADTVLAALERATTPGPRVALVRILGRIGGEEAYKAVAAATGDADAAVRDAAVRALVAWPDTRAAEALFGLSRNAENETHRVLALRGYVRLLGLQAATKPARAASQLAAAMAAAKTADTRKAVLGGLANIPHIDSLDLAMSYVDDASVRAEAGLAAASIARRIAATDRNAARAAMQKLAASSDKRIAGNARAVIAKLDRLGDAITAWRVAGPYTAQGKKYNALFDVVFPPEKPNAEDVAWRALPAGTDTERPCLLDLLKLMPGQQRAAYVLTWLHVTTAQPARLEIGSDDGVKAWLNGELVHANNVARAAKPYTDRADITLKPGWNQLLLKITQNNSSWAFCARVCHRDGAPLSSIRVDATQTPNAAGMTQ